MSPRPFTTLVWVEQGTWPTVVDAAARRPETDRLVLVATTGGGGDAPLRAGGALFGRGRRPAEPRAAALTHDAARDLLDKAAAGVRRACETRVLKGSPERALVEATNDADLLLVVRDGDRSRLGPHSLGKATRFVIDHAPCTVALLWPEGETPDLSTLPSVLPGEH